MASKIDFFGEVNFDGLIGLTHNYGGLSFGNIASANNKAKPASPKSAALQGLGKAWALAQAGYKQGIFPPQERPFLPVLRKIGFVGDNRQLLAQAAKDARLLANISASSSMWAANAGTVSPKTDCKDNKTHFTPANLITNTHRALEAAQTTKMLRTIFCDEGRFLVHEPLPAQSLFADEGAANFMRMTAQHGQKGIELFVYGRDGYEPYQGKFPARQTLQSFEAIARNHQIDDAKTIFARQSQRAIDAGAFHNDVVASANENVLFYHEYAFEDEEGLKRDIITKCDFEPIFIKVENKDVPIEDAIKSYLFNTQILSKAGERMTIIAPMECYETPSVKKYLDELVTRNTPIGAVEYVDVRQSMNNGGGPACLRLRVAMDDYDLKSIKARVMLDESLYNDLKAWIEKYYCETLSPEDLGDFSLLENNYSALDELTKIMCLGDTFYDFQRQ
jgi:succinylarginine dihydrolase